MSASNPITILLADDHPLVRDGLRARLEAEPHFRVVAEAGNAEEALRLAGVHRPAVLLADMRLGGMSGMELAEAFSRQLPQTAVILMSMLDDAQCAGWAIGAGARGACAQACAGREVGGGDRGGGDGVRRPCLRRRGLRR